MLILQTPRRVVKWERSGSLKFPAWVHINAELEPKELFGEAPLSGKLDVVPPGQVQLAAELHHGSIGVKSQEKRLPRMFVDTKWFDVPLVLDGSVASTHFECTHPDSFFKCVDMFAEILPAIVSSALASPVEVVRIYGEAGGVGFRAEFSGTIPVLIKTANLGASLSKKMELISEIPQHDSDRLFSAHRYLLQARRLRYVSTYATQFISERLLNLYKMVEVLFGRSADNVRAAFKCMRIKSNVAEMVASLCYIRDSADVGHPAIQLLEPNEYETVREFVIAIEEVMSWLLDHIMTELISGRFGFGSEVGSGVNQKNGMVPRADKKKGGGKSDRGKIITIAATHLKSVEYLRPGTFVETS